MSHTASSKRIGISDDELAALADPSRWQDVFAPAEVAVLELASLMAGPRQPLEPSLVTRLRDAFDESQLAELVAVAGEANFNNRVGNAATELLRGDARG